MKIMMNGTGVKLMPSRREISDDKRRDVGNEIKYILGLKEKPRRLKSHTKTV